MHPFHLTGTDHIRPEVGLIGAVFLGSKQPLDQHASLLNFKSTDIHDDYVPLLEENDVVAISSPWATAASPISQPAPRRSRTCRTA